MINSFYPSQPGKCATPLGNSTANGTVITLWTCNGHYLQQWHWNGDKIVHMTSGKCLTPRGDSYTNGTVLTLWPCTGADSQDWIESEAGPLPRLHAVIRTQWHNDRCLTNKGGSFANGTWVTIWDCSFGEPGEQNWSL
ncbi:ricin-type beta-trefoil lectin domain protein [Streptomyces bambusae]|uniref:RICIN domain-containing protein n=1 Tax=Streptomyces bambusae TaxID=1550616 RepID=UPI001CFFFCC2|nr:ricin-type beta-trefoil lectin domain protein [Streptomyces bambusae]MCB5170347.1 ricin-type beta-trefoil lectin domain protein [Streptomyces bambusae]